jgi:hypothetical protein
VSWEDALHLASHRIHFLPLLDVLRSVHLQFAHTSDIPANTEIDFLAFPVLDKDDAPKAGEGSESR